LDPAVFLAVPVFLVHLTAMTDRVIEQAGDLK
jgi:hypothetical protein